MNAHCKKCFNNQIWHIITGSKNRLLKNDWLYESKRKRTFFCGFMHLCISIDLRVFIRCLFATRAEHEYKYKYKYRIKTIKNNQKKKKKPTVPDRRTEKTREYKYKYTKSSKLHVIRTGDRSKREQVASFCLRSQCHTI